MVEFDCAECGRHIFYFGADEAATSERLRCATCLNVPSWYRNPDLRALFEPDPHWQPPQ
jgi:hypothetical protein